MKEKPILLAEIDLYRLRASKWNLDVASHYARPDAFELTARKRAALIIRAASLFFASGCSGPFNTLPLPKKYSC